MVDIKKVADEAEVIIDGYAFSRFEGGYRVLNLNAPDKAAVFAADGSVLETTMNDFDEKTVTDEKLRDFSASVQTKCLHAIRDIRIAWRRFLNSVFEYISGVRGIRKFFSSLQSAGQGPGSSSHSDSEFPLHRNAPEQIRQCSSQTV